MPEYEYDAILVPTDGSEGARHAGEQAIALAERYDATLHALSVVDVNDIGLRAPSDADSDRIESSLREQAESATGEIATMAADAGLDVEETMLVGVPHTAIVDYADDEGVDLIVMGTHGRTGLGRVLLGSVAERVVRKAPMPVLTIRSPAHPARADDGETGAEDGGVTDA